MNIQYLWSFVADLVSSPHLMSTAEISLLAVTPASVFYQPAIFNTGIALNHSNPFGFTELNVLHLASQFKIKNEKFSLGSITLNNNIIDDKVIYLGYNKNIYGISLGISGRYYHFGINGYENINTFTSGIGAVWENNIFTHGLSYSNITHTKVNGVELPSVFKYECMISPFEKTRFGLAVEKEKSFEMRYAFATNHKMSKYFYFSSGFITKPNQFCAGFTCTVTAIEISYGIKTHHELGYTQAVGVLYKL